MLNISISKSSLVKVACSKKGSQLTCATPIVVIGPNFGPINNSLNYLFGAAASGFAVYIYILTYTAQ